MINLCRCLYNSLNTRNQWYVKYCLLAAFSFYLYIIIYQNFAKQKLYTSDIIFQATSSSLQQNDFRLYSESRSYIEYKHIQIHNDFRFKSVSNIYPKKNIHDYSKPLKYSESTFRSASTPILWLDAHGDVRWNRIAEREMINYLIEKQYPSHLSKSSPTTIINACLSRQLFLLEQWPMGFFSRFHCFIEQFGQTLYSPSMVLLIPRTFVVSGASQDDFLGEGIIRYFQPFSVCSAYANHPQMRAIRQIFRSITTLPNRTKIVRNIKQLLEQDEQTISYIYSNEIWRFGYDHAPHRRWLFDRNRLEMKKILHYNSSIELLIDHSNEHIYSYQGSSLELKTWLPRNLPQGPPKDVLPGTSTNLTIADQIFSSFLRYMFIRMFSLFSPRIETLAKLLSHHWSEYFAERNNQPYNTSLSNLAVLFIRRGDKMPEDSFWQKHRRWRNISMYVKGIVDDEKHRSINYSSIFVMTDDKDVMNSIQEYSNIGLLTGKQDEQYARKHLHGRQILYNIFAPQSCFNPFIRIGFEQFLVNILFILNHASLVIGHTDSNVGRYLEEIIYVYRQHQHNIQTRTIVRNAPDTLD